MGIVHHRDFRHPDFTQGFLNRCFFRYEERILGEAPQVEQRFDGQVIAAFTGLIDPKPLADELDNFSTDGLWFNGLLLIKLFQGGIGSVARHTWPGPANHVLRDVKRQDANDRTADILDK